MRWGIAAALAAALAASPWRGAAAQDGSLERTAGFERGFATSLYVFDACGDAVAGRLYRQALAERFNQCPFSAEARSRFGRRTRLQQAKARTAIQAMIDQGEGVPMRLEGMAATCREQRSSEGYQAVRAKLERYGQGNLAAAEVVAAPCDAAEVGP